MQRWKDLRVLQEGEEMLRDITYNITDGQLGLANTTGTGIHVKIGASPIVSAEPILINGSMSVERIKKKLGLSPLADAVMDSVENGAAKIYCLPVNTSQAGTITEIIKMPADAPGTVTVDGTPTNAFKIIVKIIGKGGLNLAVFRYSLNNGVTWSSDITVPTSGKYAVEEAGVTFTFSPDPEFRISDTYTCATTEPQMTHGDILTAADKLKDISAPYEFVHVTGASAPELWAAISVKQKELVDKYRKPVFFLLEAYRKGKETMAEYISGLEADRRKVYNYDIQVVTARGYYTGMDNTTRDINLANIVCGLYARASVQESIGRTAAYSIPEDKLSCLLPAGIEEDDIDALDRAGYLTFRKYDGLAGHYVTNARMMCPEDSDYRYAEDVRVKNKIIRLTRQAALKRLQEDVDIENVDADLSAKAQFITADVEKQMVDTKEISTLNVLVPSGQDILRTEKMEMQIRYVPMGKIREIAIDLGMENPYAS